MRLLRISWAALWAVLAAVVVFSFWYGRNAEWTPQSPTDGHMGPCISIKGNPAIEVSPGMGIDMSTGEMTPTFGF